MTEKGVGDATCSLVCISSLLTLHHRGKLEKESQVPHERTSYSFLSLLEEPFIIPSISNTNICHAQNSVSFGIILMGLQQSLQ